MQKNLIIALVFAILVAVFSIQNSGPVSLLFFGWEFSTSLVVVVLGAAVLGALIMWIIGSFKQLKVKKEKRNLKKQIKNLEDEKNNLEQNIKDLEKKLNHRKNIKDSSKKTTSIEKDIDNNKSNNEDY